MHRTRAVRNLGWVVAVLLAASLLTMAFRPMFQAAAPIIPEPWGTIATLIVVPLLVQGLKIYREKTGKEFSRLATQIIVFAIAIPFTWLGGGFIGLKFAPLPVMSQGGDLAVFLQGIVDWLGETLRVLTVAWTYVMGVYGFFGRAVLERAKFATQAALAKRAP